MSLINILDIQGLTTDAARDAQYWAEGQLSYEVGEVMETSLTPSSTSGIYTSKFNNQKTA